MAKLEITLRQDTPMWHFRPDEKGCCLRASEVKPKLDKFLTDKLGSGVEDKWNLKNQGDEKSTHLDYKMTFEAIGEPDSDIKNLDKFPLFFGNMGNGEKKKLIYYSDGIRMTIFSLHSDLVKKIDPYICEFFACHSFGTRQSKGFGCFYPTSIKLNDKDSKHMEKCLDVIKTLAQYKFEVKKDSFIELFREIDSFHKKIRSGINLPNFYFKSLMYHYVDSTYNIHWEKPQIRHFFGLMPISDESDDGSVNDIDFSYRWKYIKKCGADSDNEFKDLEDCPRNTMKNDYIKFGTEQDNFKFDYIDDKKKIIPLFRDALGLSTSQTWKFYNVTINIEDTNTENGIARYKSPIFYRPIKNGDKYYVYIFLTEIDNRLKEATFKIIATYHNQEYSEETYPLDGTLFAKIFPDFSLFHYFDYISKKLEKPKLQQP